VFLVTKHTLLTRKPVFAADKYVFADAKHGFEDWKYGFTAEKPVFLRKKGMWAERQQAFDGGRNSTAETQRRRVGKHFFSAPLRLCGSILRNPRAARPAAPANTLPRKERVRFHPSLENKARNENHHAQDRARVVVYE
jgi:hypothetical protein